MKSILSLVVALVLSASALANSPHVRIHVSGDGSTGSGTLIGPGLVVTCNHLFTESRSGVVVRFRDGRQVAAQVIAQDRANDLAALVIEPVEIRPFAVSSEDPSGALSACGYGPNGQFRGIRGRITGYAQAQGSSYPSTTIQGGVRSGDSGGGVFNDRNELVGVIWGTQGGETYAMCGEPVRKLVEQTQCYNGRCYSPIYTQPSRPVYPTQPVRPAPPTTTPPSGKPCECEAKWTAVSSWRTDVDQQLTSINDIRAKLDANATATANLQQNLATTVQNTVNTHLQQHPAQVSEADRQAIVQAVMVEVNQLLATHAANNKPPTIDEILAKLDHETPIRVYAPDGRLLGEAKTNIFKKDGSIDFTFNPRALLDASK